MPEGLTFFQSLSGFILLGGGLWFFGFVMGLILRKPAMGLGDVHLLAAVGAFVGWKDPLLIFFIANLFF